MIRSKTTRISRCLLAAALAGTALTASACSSITTADSPAAEPEQHAFMSSGTIILSRKVPTQSVVPAMHSAPRLMAPLIGYFPPAAGYIPADNESWLEIEAASGSLKVYKGREIVKQLQGEGSVTIAPGEYYLRHKQKEPVWYAPDSYFAKRHLATPEKGASVRFRRGALGEFVLYPTAEFPIHCAPIWSDEVGGLRLSKEELASIYYLLPVGAPVVIR